MIRPLLVPGFRSAFNPEPIGADGRSHLDNIWEWARFCFERLVLRIECARSLAHMHRITRRYQRDYLAWLEPVECMVRRTLVARAITWLTMTTEGRRLLAETPKQPLPGPQPAPVRNQQQQQEQQEQQEQEEEQERDYALQPLSRTPEEIEAAYLALPVRREQTGDPATWICPFAILHFDRSHPPSEDGWHGEPSGLTPEEIADLDYIPLMPSSRARPGGNHGPSLRPRRRGPHPAALKLARVEALGRILANPAPHIRRAARMLARLPLGVLAPPDPPPRWWMQGEDVCRALDLLLISAINALNRTQGAPPEPG